MIDARCLYTIVRNKSTEAETFSFLPPHGKELQPGEEYYVFGDLSAAVAGFDRDAARRSLMALQRALDDGVLEIVQTPAVILRDTNDGTIKQLKLTGGVLGVTNPCWTVSVSSSEMEPNG